MIQCICPTCGSFVAAKFNPELAQIGLEIVATPGERLLFKMLAKAYPNPVRSTVILNEMYGLRADGGPERGSAVVKVQISRLRRALAPHGWTVPRRTGGAGVQAWYCLERIDQSNPLHQPRGVRRAG